MSKLNRTALRTIEILEYLSKITSANLEQICGALNLPKTSGYDIIKTLVATQMVQVLPGHIKEYALDLGAYSVGMGYMRNFEVFKDFGPPMQALAVKLNKTCFFAQAQETSVVYVLRREPPEPILSLGKIGGTNPMYCTALGKAILSTFDEAEQDRLISQMTFEQRTDFTITDADALKQDLKKIKQRGYSVDFRELEDHGLCVAAPVCDKSGFTLGAVSVSGLYRPSEDYHSTGNEIKALAEHMSKLCGHMP